MIRPVEPALTPWHEGEVGPRYILEPCSDECTLRSCPPEGEIVAHGVFRGTVAVLAGDQLWLNIARGTHHREHPLVPSGGDPVSDVDRPALLRRLLEARPRFVAPISAVCACSVKMPVVKGVVLVDDETRPAWHRRLFREAREPAVSSLPWPPLASALADLADGLKHMHDVGIAHNDPFPYNAIVTEIGEAVWIDFNNCVSATPESRAVDVVGFVVYTLAISLMRSGKWPPSLLRSIRACLGQVDAGDLLSDLARRLRATPEQGAQYQPLVDGGVGHCLAPLNSRQDVIGDVARTLTAKGLATFFNEYGLLRQVAARREQLLNAERTRHRVAEREIHRTGEIRRELEIGALKSWVTELERGKAWLDEQRVNWQAKAERLDAEKEISQSKLSVLEQENATLLDDLRQAEDVIDAMRPIVAETEELRKALEKGRRAMRSLDFQANENEQLKAALMGSQAELQAIRSGVAWRLMNVMWRWRARLAPPRSFRARALGRLARLFGLKRATSAPAPAPAPGAEDERRAAEREVYMLMNQQRAKIRDARARSEMPD